MMLIERIQQQLRIIITAHRYFSIGEYDIKFTVEYTDHTWRYVHDYTRTVLTIMYGTSDSTDTQFVVIRNHITGVGHLFTSVTADEFVELELYLEEAMQREHSK